MDRLPEQIIQPLLAWYAQHKRALPWRQDADPYRVWVSEIMLQQTRIEAVKKYYTRFMSALPDVVALSTVDDDALLKLWEGLGYYSRARNLKKAAQCVMREYGGQFPTTYEQLRRLPGIGDYTAGAIASICFNERVPAVDGNVMRVIARVLADRENVMLPKTKKMITALLQEAMPRQAGDFNEALMELGEVICLPNGEPDCSRCPLQPYCEAYRQRLTANIPVRVKAAKRSKADKTVFLIRAADGCIAIEKRDETGLLSGMYQLPNIENFHPDTELYTVLTAWRLKPADLQYTRDVKHVFTHVDWYMKGYRVKADRKDARFLWVTPEELRDVYPLPTAFQKLIDDTAATAGDTARDDSKARR